MEATTLYVLALVLVGAGCAATILSAHVFPLWIRARGQAHGRYAGLSCFCEVQSGGSERPADGTGSAIKEEPEPRLIVA
jgi:hypothetical protein